MRILSLNCWGGRLGLPLVDYLRSADADVLCLQEVVHAPGCPHEWLSYREDGAELPQRANLFRELADTLPSHVAFFCPAARLVVELDGESHVGREAADARRTAYLESIGLRVIRFWNTDVFDDCDSVLEAIYAACEAQIGGAGAAVNDGDRPIHPVQVVPPTPTPPPHGGRGDSTPDPHARRESGSSADGLSPSPVRGRAAAGSAAAGWGEPPEQETGDDDPATRRREPVRAGLTRPRPTRPPGRRRSRPRRAARRRCTPRTSAGRPSSSAWCGA